MDENPWKDKYLVEAAKHDETVRKLAALTSHLNQVHEELGGTDTVLTLEAAQLVMVRLAACERVVEQLRGLRAPSLCCDGENNDEVDAFREGYTSALDDMRDILRAAVTAETQE